VTTPGATGAGASVQGAIAIDAGDLSLGGGLLALVRPLVAKLAPGGTLAILSSSPEVGDDLATWCRLEHHVYCGAEMIDRGRVRHLLVRGPLGVVLADAPDLATASWPAHADPRSGFAPRGATVEPGGPAYPFALADADRVAPPEVRSLYDQAVTGAWDAARDIPWHTVRPLSPALAAAVGQVMSFLAENELAALYVPARFLPRIHPAYVEAAMFLATQMSDESRHIDVFLRRASQGGSRPGVSSVTTARSLLSLLESDDLTEASFLLSVLGEGTFLDLLRFVEQHAPDEATAVLARRARTDEARHVHFGVMHVRHALAADPGATARLEAAVARRAARMDSDGVPPALQDALTILAAGGTAPAAVARGHKLYRALLDEMDEARRKRLVTAGFSAEQAARLSALHSPNFM